MNRLQFSALASGSKGNAVAVFPGDGKGFLLDCGLSNKELNRRLTMINKKCDDIAWVLMTHCHRDHWRYETVMSGSQSISSWWNDGYTKSICGASVTAFRLKHDVQCFGFRVEYNGINIAYVTDTAYIPEESMEYLFDLDALIIEANYREQILSNYPEYVHGDPASRHLSNEQVSCILSTVNSPRLKHVVLTHLSDRFNTPAFASNAGVAGASRASVIVSGQDNPTKIITIMR